MTVFTAIASAVSHPGSRAWSHWPESSAEHLPGLPLQDRYEFIGPHITFVFSSLIVRKLAFCRFGSKFFNTGLKLWISTELQERFGFVRQNNLKNGPYPPIKRSRFRYRRHSVTLLHDSTFWEAK